MPDIPPEVIRAAMAAVRARHNTLGADVIEYDEPDFEADIVTALEAAEAVWPHKPPARDPASTTALTTEHTWHHIQREPAQSRAQVGNGDGFGFGKVTA